MRPILFTIVSLLALQLAAQDCKVKTKALEGTYQGECQKGVANGQGTAKGIDSYTGDFKSGVPHGSGEYTWANGDRYVGAFEKGNRHGYGVMFYADKSKGDSLQGYWKKDKYVGKFAEPYIVHGRTNVIRDVNVDRDKTSNLKEITIVLESMTGGTRNISGSSIAKPTVSSIEIIKGLYVQVYEQELSIKKTLTTLRMVQFPFRARYVIGNEVLDLEILEEGKWQVEVKLQQ